MPVRSTDSPLEGWPSSAQAARTLGVSIRTLRRREQEGRLKPRLDEQGHRRYDPRELEAVRSQHEKQLVEEHQDVGVLSPTAAESEPARGTVATGERAGRVFARLNAGADPRLLVPELKEAPEVIMQLQRLWAEMGGTHLITSAHQRTLRSLGLRAFADVDQHIEQVRELVALVDAFHRKTYPCCGCGRPILVDDNSWDAVRRSHVLRGWGHGGCVDNDS